MNIKKVEKQLRKINQLFDNIREDDKVSLIERDLMMSYVRELYEKLIDDREPTSKNSELKKQKDKKVDRKVEEPTSNYVPQDSIANVVLQEVKETEPSDQSYEPIVEAPQQQIAPVVNEPVVAEPIVETPSVPQELLALFEFDSVNELSDKLSRSPITDLTKSMGINEKIFTVQELFGGDSALFANAMQTMDKFSSLEQARDYLVENVAVEQNWTAEDKVKKALNFIKLISRRY